VESDYSIYHGLLGGALIGLASLLAALATGKIPGTSGIPQPLGASVFGVGRALAGFCSGQAIASLPLIRTEALLFVPAMAAGMFLARVAGADRD
jgi:hypothetical protein